MVETTKDVSSIGIILLGFGAGCTCLQLYLYCVVMSTLTYAAVILWTLTKDLLFTETPENVFDKSLASIQTDQRVHMTSHYIHRITRTGA